MKVISYAGKRFSTLGVTAGMRPDLSGEEASPEILERIGGAALWGGYLRGGRIVTVQFLPQTGNFTEYTLLRLKGALDLLDDEPRWLVAQLDADNDGVAETNVRVLAAVSPTFRWVGINVVEVDFYALDGTWRELSASATVPAAVTLTALAGAFTPVNAGFARAFPTIKLGWTTQRATQASDVGWKRRRLITFTNNGDEAIVNRTYVLDCGDTAALVAAGKSLNNGVNNLIFCEGESIAREIIAWNAERSFLAFNITVPAGASRIYEWLYDNDHGTVHADLVEELNYQPSMEENIHGSQIDLYGVTGEVTGAASTTTVINTAAAIANAAGRLRNGFVQFTSGALDGQRRQISTNASTTQFTVKRAFSTTPTAADTFVIWMSGWFVDGGLASAGSSTTLTDSAQNGVWQTNQLAGMRLWNVTKGIGPFVIQSNTNTGVITISGTMTAPSVNDVYYVEGNGVHRYEVDRANTAADEWRGMVRPWPRDKAPSRIFYGDELAEAWNLATFLRNNDDYAQRDYFFATVAYGILFAQRRVSSDKFLIGKYNGDGMQIAHPLGYRAMYFDWELQNEDRGDGTGVGKSIVAGQRGGGGDWYRAVEDATVRAAITAVSPQWIDWTTAIGGTAKTIYMGNVPADDEQIPSTAKKLADVQARAYQVMQLYVDQTNLSVTIGSEVEVYDTGAVIDVGGANGTARPFDRVRAGHEIEDQSGYVFLESGQELWIRADPQDADEPLCAIYASGVLVRETPWAARFFRVIDDVDGAALEVEALQFAPLPPGENAVTNPTAATNVTGWTEEGTVGTITVNWNREAAVFWDAAGSFEADVSANTTAGAGTFASRFISTAFTVEPGQLYEVTAAMRTTNANLEPRLAIRWYDGGGSFISESGADDWAPAINVWYPRGASGVAPSNAATAKISLALYSNASGATGQARWDGVVCGPPALWVQESEMGTITAQVEWTEGYQG